MIVTFAIGSGISFVTSLALQEWFDAAKIPRAMSEISLMSGRTGWWQCFGKEQDEQRFV